MVLIFALIIIIAFLIYRYRCYIKRYEDIEKLPGPSTFQLIKELYISSRSKAVVNYFVSLNDRYGPVVKIWIKPFKPRIITTDMDYCNKIYKAKDLHITPTFSEVRFFGEGIATNTDYDVWKSDKQVIKKAITREYISNRLRLYDKKFDELLGTIGSQVGKTVDFQALIYRKIGEVSLGAFIQPNVDLTEEQIDTYLKYKKDYYMLLLERLNSFHMIGVLHRFTKNYKLITQCGRDIREFTEKWLERFKRLEEGLREKHSLVYAMIDSGMSNRRIVDNINTIIQAGHGTSIWPVSRIFDELSKNPEIQEKVLDEILTVVGPDLSTMITLDHLDKMPYLQALVKEGLRVHMPAPFLDRILLYDITINNVRIPKGTVVMFNYHGILQSEENYDDAKSFRPERFLKKNVTLRGQKAYIPFGYGLKSCPGKHIAYAAIKLLIAKIVRDYEILPPEEEREIQQRAEILYKSLNGVHFAFRKRTFGQTAGLSEKISS